MCYNESMIYAVNCNALWSALAKLGKIVAENEEKSIKTVVFCEDRLTLAAERAVCAAVGGTFSVSVYTFARFLSSERGKPENLLSSQGSAMVIRRIIEESRGELSLFKKLTAASSAGQVYDTIALLYSSRISADDVKSAAACGGHLASKLKDIAIIYEKYMRYLEGSGAADRNVYLKGLAPAVEESGKIRGNCVVFLGFQAFTCTTTECARAAFSVAHDVYGLFIGGAGEIYVNEANASFVAAAREFGGARISSENKELCRESEILRTNLFDPLCFKKPAETARNVFLIEAADGEEEMEFIAASIKKQILDSGERYAKISVMLPDVAGAERSLARAFAHYRIPYYADRRIRLSEHPLCAFVCDYLSCALYGCRPEDVDAVVSSPYFTAEREDKDIFRNYALRLANFRGGIRREPNEETLKSFGFAAEVVKRVREAFLKGLSLLEKSLSSGICGGVKQIFDLFGTEDAINNLSEKYADEYPTAAAFGKKAFVKAVQVLDEADTLARDLPPKEFLKVLKSGFAASEVSLIPPKADAVFVGDLSATVNTGSDVVYAARLSGDVPAPSPDAALLTDREISVLENACVNISPKISQVNARRREIAALNICAFRKQLYLSYPVYLAGEEQSKSRIVAYASALFKTKAGANLSPVDVKRIERSGKSAPYYCSERIPATRQVLKSAANGGLVSAVYEVLRRHGYAGATDGAFDKKGGRKISCAGSLYLKRGSISPTTLETYFTCPYLNFMRNGLRVCERDEGAMRVVDAGNFIHSVLEQIARETVWIADEDALKRRASDVAGEMLTRQPYSQLSESGSGRYTAEALVSEAERVCLGMYRQLKNSSFTVSDAESVCSLYLADGVKVYGRIDRTDISGDMVRIIDYKTGAVDASPTAYYMGEKLQLPLYLLAAAEGKRAAGAYYFPASLTYSDKEDGEFRLQGFMDGSEDVVAASDTNVKTKEKSRYVNAYLGAKNPDSAMPREDFKYFLDYARLVAGGGVKELLGGNIAPSPAAGVCGYCKMGGSCGFSLGRDGEERTAEGTVKCSEIAEIVKRTAEGK